MTRNTPPYEADFTKPQTCRRIPDLGLLRSNRLRMKLFLTGSIDVRDLRVWLDSQLTMKLRMITSVCFYRLRNLRQLRDKASQDTMRQLVTSLVLSRIDYCNSVLDHCSSTACAERCCTSHPATGPSVTHYCSSS